MLTPVGVGVGTPGPVKVGDDADGRGSVAKVVGTPCETNGTLDEAPPLPGTGELETPGVGVGVGVGMPALGPVGVTARTGRLGSSSQSSPPTPGVGRALGLLDTSRVGAVDVTETVLKEDEWSLKAPPGTEKENEDVMLGPVGLGWKGTTSVGMPAGRLLDRPGAVPVLRMVPVGVMVLVRKPVGVTVGVAVLVLAETLSVGSHGSLMSPVGKTPVGVTVLEAGVLRAGVLRVGVVDTRPRPGGEVAVSRGELLD